MSIRCLSFNALKYLCSYYIKNQTNRDDFAFTINAIRRRRRTVKKAEEYEIVTSNPIFTKKPSELTYYKVLSQVNNDGQYFASLLESSCSVNGDDGLTRGLKDINYLPWLSDSDRFQHVQRSKLYTPILLSVTYPIAQLQISQEYKELRLVSMEEQISYLNYVTLQYIDLAIQVYEIFNKIEITRLTDSFDNYYGPTAETVPRANEDSSTIIYPSWDNADLLHPSTIDIPKEVPETNSHDSENVNEIERTSTTTNEKSNKLCETGACCDGDSSNDSTKSIEDEQQIVLATLQDLTKQAEALVTATEQSMQQLHVSWLIKEILEEMKEQVCNDLEEEQLLEISDIMMHNNDRSSNDDALDILLDSMMNSPCSIDCTNNDVSSQLQSETIINIVEENESSEITFLDNSEYPQAYQSKYRATAAQQQQHQGDMTPEDLADLSTTLPPTINRIVPSSTQRVWKANRKQSISEIEEDTQEDEEEYEEEDGGNDDIIITLANEDDGDADDEEENDDEEHVVKRQRVDEMSADICCWNTAFHVLLPTSDHHEEDKFINNVIVANDHMDDDESSTVATDVVEKKKKEDEDEEEEEEIEDLFMFCATTEYTYTLLSPNNNQEENNNNDTTTADDVVYTNNSHSNSPIEIIVDQQQHQSDIAEEPYPTTSTAGTSIYSLESLADDDINDDQDIHSVASPSSASTPSTMEIFSIHSPHVPIIIEDDFLTTQCMSMLPAISSKLQLLFQYSLFPTLFDAKVQVTTTESMLGKGQKIRGEERMMMMSSKHNPKNSPKNSSPKYAYIIDQMVHYCEEIFVFLQSPEHFPAWLEPTTSTDEQDGDDHDECTDMMDWQAKHGIIGLHTIPFIKETQWIYLLRHLSYSTSQIQEQFQRLLHQVSLFLETIHIDES